MSDLLAGIFHMLYQNKGEEGVPESSIRKWGLPACWWISINLNVPFVKLKKNMYLSLISSTTNNIYKHLLAFFVEFV